MSDNFKRIYIWSGWFRLSHLLIGLTTLLLLATGNLIQYSPALEMVSADIHNYCAGFFLAGLFIRIILMFIGKPHERLSYLIPKAAERMVMLKTLRFYVLLGKARLPNWYAQNPFWKPFYLCIYVVLIGLLISGYVMNNGGFLWGLPPQTIHTLASNILLVFSLLHIFTVVWHDYKGEGSDVSAIINGIRTFTIEKPPEANSNSQAVKFTPMNKKSS